MEVHSTEYNDCKEVFNDLLLQLVEDFVAQLDFAKGTKDKYHRLISCMIKYLHDYTHHLQVQDILPGDVANRFYNQWKYDFDFEPNYQKQVLQFFLYLKEQGYENAKVIRHLEKI